VNPKGRFGYELSNPISADGGTYCSKLYCPQGHPYWFHRLGSFGKRPDGHIIDKIELICFAGESHIFLFFDMYHDLSTQLPDGLSFGSNRGIGDVHSRYLNFPEGLPGNRTELDLRNRRQ